MNRGYRNKSLDKTSELVVYEGANMTELAELFQMDRRTLKRKLVGVKQDAVRNGAPVWRVSTVAPYLVKPVFDIEAYIRRMNHAELPPMLTKEFWAGQCAKLAYYEEEGDLWRTEKVIEILNDIFRLVRMTLLLLPDRIEKTSTISPAQRKIVNEQVDGLLEEMRNVIERTMKESGNGNGEEAEDLSDL